MRVWLFSPCLPRNTSLSEFVDHCRLLNGAAVFEGGPSAGQHKDSFPIAELELRLDTFDLDCFFYESCIFVSAHLREAMALPPSSIQFFDVDASRSAPVPRQKDYKIMNVPVTEEVSDLSTSEFMTRDLIPGMSVPFNIQKISIRPNATPSFDLFHDSNFRGYIFCTDALAIRALRAECTGIRFSDPTRMSVDRPMRFRTLRGLEESAPSNSTHSVLIERF